LETIASVTHASLLSLV